MNTKKLSAVLGCAAVMVSAGCSSGGHSSAASSSSPASSSSSEATVSGTPQSKWPTRAEQSGGVDPNGTPKSSPSFAHMPSKKQQETPKKFMDAFLHTDGVSQDAWANGVKPFTGPQFGGWLVSQGLERLPHHVHVEGKPRLTDVSPDQPEATWSVVVKGKDSSDDGTYVLTQDLSSPDGKIQDMTFQPGSAVPTDPD